MVRPVVVPVAEEARPGEDQIFTIHLHRMIVIRIANKNRTPLQRESYFVLAYCSSCFMSGLGNLDADSKYQDCQ